MRSAVELVHDVEDDDDGNSGYFIPAEGERQISMRCTLIYLSMPQTRLVLCKGAASPSRATRSRTDWLVLNLDSKYPAL